MGVGPLATVGKALRLRHWLVWGVAGLAGALAFAAASTRPPTYQATALLQVDESQNVSQGFDIALQADQYLQQRYISMATSQAVLTRVCDMEIAAQAAPPAANPAAPAAAPHAAPTRDRSPSSTCCRTSTRTPPAACRTSTSSRHD